MPWRRSRTEQFHEYPIAHVSARAHQRFDRLIAALQLHMSTDRARHEALPVGERRQLPRRLRGRERFELLVILQLGRVRRRG
jgi:hypothetical protein